MMRKLRLLAAVFLLTGLWCACQPTPEDPAIYGKNSSEPVPVATESQEKDAPSSASFADKFSCVREIGSTTLCADAEIIVPKKGNIQQLRVARRDFSDGASMQRMVEAVFPDGEIYHDDGIDTPEEIMDEIVRIKQDLAKAEENPQEVLEDGTILYRDTEVLKEWLADYEKLYQEAKEKRVPLSPPNYAFQRGENAEQYANFKCRLSGGEWAAISVQNSETLTGFWVTTGTDITPQDDLCLTADEAAQNADFQEARVIADELVQRLGAENLALDSACYGSLLVDGQTEIRDAAQCFFYTPVFGDLHLNYAPRFIGTTAQYDEQIYAQTIGPEYLSVTVYEGKVVSAAWREPLTVVHVENNDCDILPWGDVEEVFNTQMERIFNDSGEYRNSDVKVNRVVLGLAKVLVKNSGGDYRLVPAWSFFGTISDKDAKGGARGTETCLLTVNAMDGTCIDRGLMY